MRASCAVRASFVAPSVPANSVLAKPGLLTSGMLVKKVIERLRELGAGKIEEMPGELETVEFKLPSELGAA
jgi:hypothetical protein